MARKETGFTLVEIVIAAAIISFSLVSMVAIASNSISYSRRAINTYVASASLEEGMEVMRMMRAANWGSISSLVPGTPYYLSFATPANTWSIGTVPVTDGIYTRTVTASAVKRSNGAIVTDGTGTVDAGTVLVTVAVTWKESGVVVQKSLSEYLSNIL